VHPGNQRGAIWADKTLQQSTWIADVEFRANGPERGGGNFNIWLVKDGSHAVGTNSVYSVGRFEGLVLVIDQHGGSGGMLRGFLNDGSIDYSSTRDVDNLAFGHCRFAYRNLGRPTQIKLRQTETKFSVEVAGRMCFESDKIRLPSGYNFGVTASSADNPDSFEVFKLVVLTGENSHEYAGMYQTQQQAQQQQQQQQTQQQQPPVQRRQIIPDDPYDNIIPDEDPDKIVSSKAQFADLHNRIQSVNHHLSTIFRSMAQNAAILEQRHSETSQLISDIKGLLSSNNHVVSERLRSLENKIQELDRQITQLQSEFHARIGASENAIMMHVSDRHAALAGDVREHTSSGYMRLLIILLGGQAAMAGGYFYYKKKRMAVPKKYL